VKKKQTNKPSPKQNQNLDRKFPRQVAPPAAGSRTCPATAVINALRKLRKTGQLLVPNFAPESFPARRILSADMNKSYSNGSRQLRRQNLDRKFPRQVAPPAVGLTLSHTFCYPIHSEMKNISKIFQFLWQRKGKVKLSPIRLGRHFPGAGISRRQVSCDVNFFKDISLIISHLQQLPKKSFRQTANFQFSTTYYIEGRSIPPLGDSLRQLNQKSKKSKIQEKRDEMKPARCSDRVAAEVARRLTARQSSNTLCRPIHSEDMDYEIIPQSAL